MVLRCTVQRSSNWQAGYDSSGRAGSLKTSAVKAGGRHSDFRQTPAGSVWRDRYQETSFWTPCENGVDGAYPSTVRAFVISAYVIGTSPGWRGSRRISAFLPRHCSMEIGRAHV